MKTDMNPQAVTRRLRQTSELRRLCLKLGRNSFIKLKKSSKGRQGRPFQNKSRNNTHLTSDIY